MYIARFNLNGRSIIQARATMPQVGVSWPSVAQTVGAALFSARGGIGGELDIAIRIQFNGSQQVKIAWAFTVDAVHEMALRRFVAALTRIERLGGGVIELPASSEKFDLFFEPMPGCRVQASLSGFSAGSHPLSCDFKLIDHLDRLIGEAAIQGVAMEYQGHIAETTCDPFTLRNALLEASRLEDMPGLPDAVFQHQTTLAQRLRTSDGVMEEFIAVNDPYGLWLSHALERVFLQQYGSLGFKEPGFTPNTYAYSDEVSAGLHSIRFGPLSTEDYMAQSIDELKIREMVLWVPSTQLASILALTDPEETPLASSVESTPPPGAEPDSERDTPYGFVSYAHSDSSRVMPVIQSAIKSGVPLWWDSHIPGGSEWDAIIESRIKASKGIVLFLSDSAVSSKYVRREVKYADAIDKPILTIQLDPSIRLRYGLTMLLSQYQSLSIDNPELLRELGNFLRAIKSFY